MRSRVTLLTIVLLAVQGCSTPTSAVPVTTAPEPASADDDAVVTGVSVLPAPLYYLGENEQIWRADRDAVTLTQITSETDAVADFDVSPVDGSLVYISANSLIRTDPMGGARTVLVAGPPIPAEPDEQWYGAAFSDPVWSPDGKQIAYGSNGVNLYSLDTGTSSVLLPSDQVPDEFSDSPQLIKLFSPVEWSPDGARLLVNVSYYPEGESLTVLNVSDGTQVALTNPDGFVCCHNSWSSDGLNVYFANERPGNYGTGLWRADVAGGIGVTLIAGEKDGLYSLVAYPYQASDGQLYTFMAITQAFPEGYIPLSMTRSEPDGITGRVTLRTDSYIVAEALWDPAGLGAVIADMAAQIMAQGYPVEAINPLLWLPSDDSTAVTLPAMGSKPAWGK